MGWLISVFFCSGLFVSFRFLICLVVMCEDVMTFFFFCPEEDRCGSRMGGGRYGYIHV